MLDRQLGWPLEDQLDLLISSGQLADQLEDYLGWPLDDHLGLQLRDAAFGTD